MRCPPCAASVGQTVRRCSVQQLVALALLLGLSVGRAMAADGDVTMKREETSSGVPKVVFPHWAHRMRFTCYACHPSPFEMKAGATLVTMNDILAGKYCGICHNGKTAWAANFETCNRCHVAPK